MDDVQILQMYFERSNAMQTFWNFYISVSLALVAFFGASKRTWTVALLFSVGFVCFAAVNLGGMSHVARQRVELCQAVAGKACQEEAQARNVKVRRRAEQQPPVEISVYPPSVDEVRSLHLICDLVVLAAIWILTLFRDVNFSLRRVKPQVPPDPAG